jgi:hypothetical protein
VLEHRFVGTLAIHVGAVERTDVAQHVTRRRPVEHDVATRHGDVVEEDLGVGMAADICVLGLEAERRAFTRAVAHDQQSDAVGEPFEVARQLVLGAGGLDRLECERAVLVGALQRRAARRAEAGLRLIGVSTTSTNHTVRVSGPQMPHNGISSST